MKNSVYKVQCKTFKVARNLCGDYRAATHYGEHMNPPYCLRIVKAYRTDKVQAFRDLVAATVKSTRN